MKIVITGGTGYIGSRLSHFFDQKGHDVITVGHPSSTDLSPHNSIPHISGDITDPKVIGKIAGLNADIIIHLISLDKEASEENYLRTCRINVEPTWHLLESCTPKGLKKFIYLSTIHVYGDTKDEIIDEHHAVNPQSFYSLSHLLSEEICNHYNRTTNTECINIRLSNSYGEPRHAASNGWKVVVNDLVASAFHQKKIILHSDGTALRDFIHYSDICDGINQLLSHSIIDNNTINFCSSHSISLIQLAEEVHAVYLKRYQRDLSIYTNTDQLWVGEKKVNTQISKYSNSYARSLSINCDKSLNSGIEEFFIYLEKIYGSG